MAVLTTKADASLQPNKKTHNKYSRGCDKSIIKVRGSDGKICPIRQQRPQAKQNRAKD